MCVLRHLFFFFFSSRRRHTRFDCDWSSDVCSSDLPRDIEGKQALFVVNLEPRKMRGVMSEGMLFDIGYADGLCPVLAIPEAPCQMAPAPVSLYFGMARSRKIRRCRGLVAMAAQSFDHTTVALQPP